MRTSPPEKVAEILRASTEYLAARNVYEPGPACELLMSRLLDCGRLELHLRREQPLSEKQIDAMRRGVRRLAAGEPVQYIVGRVEFMGHSFKTDRRALVPRPETELLVEAVLGCETIWAAGNPLLCEVGTGSGCIVISMAIAKPGGRYIALDASPDALALASENAAAHGVSAAITFSGGELADAVEPDSLDAMVANLPYIPTKEWENLPVHIRCHEPRIALDGGPDGLSVIRDVVTDSLFALKPGGAVFLEIGSDQGERVSGLLAEADFVNVTVHKDLAEKDRIVTARRKPVC